MIVTKDKLKSRSRSPDHNACIEYDWNDNLTIAAITAVEKLTFLCKIMKALRVLKLQLKVTWSYNMPENYTRNNHFRK